MIQGYLKTVNTKDGKGKRGPWTLFSGIVELDNGTESGWISFGFEKPPFNKGDYVSFETEKTDRGFDYVKGSGKVLEAPKRPAQNTPAPSEPAPAAKGAYVDRNDSIVYQSSRKDAIALVAMLLEHDALPMSASAAKAGQAKRFEEIKSYVDKLTVEYYGDVQTGRILQQVVDAGATGEPATTPIGTDSGAAAAAEDND